MVQDLRSHFIFYFKEGDRAIKNKFYTRVLYVEINRIIKGVLLSCSVFQSGNGCLLYENLKQDIHLKIHEKITFERLKNIKNINGYIFMFAKNHVLNELERQNKLNRIKEVINEYQ